MSEKPSRNEEEYFVRQEADRLKTMRAQADQARVAAERRSHYLRCPKCGGTLAHQRLHGIEVDRCPECGGVWFDHGDAEQLLARDDPGAVGKVFHAIFRGVRGRTTEGA